MPGKYGEGGLQKLLHRSAIPELTAKISKQNSCFFRFYERRTDQLSNTGSGGSHFMPLRNLAALGK